MASTVPGRALATLRDIESTWLETVPRALGELLRAHPAERFYAGAFWLLYFDYTIVGVPAFASNSDAHVVVYDAPGVPPWSTRWVPAEWRWPVLDSAVGPLDPLYRALSDEMQGTSDEGWTALMDAQDRMLARVARGLTARLRGSTPGLDDFVVAVLEDRDGEERYEALVRASIDPLILPSLEGVLPAPS